MHSYLISGGSESQRKAEALELTHRFLGNPPKDIAASPDLKIIEGQEKSSLGIGEIRQAQDFLKVKPFEAKAKVVLILESQLLTLEAQNALLKTLEEPPAHSFLILAAAHRGLLLPTIVSRCARVNLRPESKNGRSDLTPDLNPKPPEGILILLKGGYGQRLNFMEEKSKLFAKKESALKILDAWLFSFEKLLREGQGQSKTWRQAARGLLTLKKTLFDSNVSPRNLIEVYLLGLPERIDSESKALGDPE